jgi:hypothetical protein
MIGAILAAVLSTKLQINSTGEQTFFLKKNIQN